MLLKWNDEKAPVRFRLSAMFLGVSFMTLLCVQPTTLMVKPLEDSQDLRPNRYVVEPSLSSRVVRKRTLHAGGTRWWKPEVCGRVDR